jgi:hypothetical protein
MPRAHDVDPVQDRKPLSAKEIEFSKIDDQAAGGLQFGLDVLAEGESIDRVDLAGGGNQRHRRANERRHELDAATWMPGFTGAGIGG